MIVFSCMRKDDLDLTQQDAKAWHVTRSCFSRLHAAPTLQ